MNRLSPSAATVRWRVLRALIGMAAHLLCRSSSRPMRFARLSSEGPRLILYVRFRTPSMAPESPVCANSLTSLRFHSATRRLTVVTLQASSAVVYVAKLFERGVTQSVAQPALRLHEHRRPGHRAGCRDF